MEQDKQTANSSWCAPTTIPKCLLTNKSQEHWEVQRGLEQLQGQRERVSCTPKGRKSLSLTLRDSSPVTTCGPRQLQIQEGIMEEKNIWPGHWVIFFMKFQTECPQTKKGSSPAAQHHHNPLISWQFVPFSYFLICWLNKYRILKYHLIMILFSKQKHQHYILYYSLL